MLTSHDLRSSKLPLHSVLRARNRGLVRDHDANGCLLRSCLCPVLSARMSSSCASQIVMPTVPPLLSLKLPLHSALSAYKLALARAESSCRWLIRRRLLLSKLPLHSALGARRLAHVRARSSCQRLLSCFLRSCPAFAQRSQRV